MSYYPVFMQLGDRTCAVFGGGTVATEKVEGLLRAGARVRLIGEPITGTLERLAEDGRVRHERRGYRPGDLAGVFLAISEPQGGGIDEQIAAEARERNVPLNVVDVPLLCSFIAPSVARRGDLVVAVSTSGKAPALAVRIREAIERQIGPHHARFLEIAGRLRGPLAHHYPDLATRKRLWYRLVDSDVVPLLEAGNDEAAIARISEIVALPRATFGAPPGGAGCRPGSAAAPDARPSPSSAVATDSSRSPGSAAASDAGP